MKNQLLLPLPELSLPGEGMRPLPPSRRIFCNRSLRLDRIEMVGFDMDYTLAIYNQFEMDRLSIEATTRKLVERGYPESLLGMRYRTNFPIRGLLIDRRLGNVLKMDRYRYVKRAYHGMRELGREERRRQYHTKRLRPGTARYHWVDTLYALSEVAVFAAAVEALEGAGRGVDYDELFADVRACIDLAHQDGSILHEVLRAPERYVLCDPDLGPTLHNLRSSGKRLFLLTNSQPSYTDALMRHLFDDILPEYPSWRNYFDVIICSAAKPGFFTEAEPFGKTNGAGVRVGGEVQSFERGTTYVAGNIEDFERIVGTGGDRVLYIGDHIYGDTLRVKKESAWRTSMIIQEMDAELEALQACRDDIDRLDLLEALRDRLHDDLRDHQMRLKALERRDANEPELEAAKVRHRRAIDRIRLRLRVVEEEHDEIETRVDAAFHPFWGSLLKSGPEVSSFGDQVENYACLYTTRVGNFLRYSPMHYFRSPRDRMPHELMALRD
ncbi:MAG: HAD-IG family 5'-nucleotidase [Myxococcota bacterium]